MATDSPIPLATSAQMLSSRYGDLVRDWDPAELDQLMVEATRECEGEVSRRLVPFTGLTETHRAEGIDPDEYADSANLPMDLQGTLGRSYAMALGASTLVRHVWLNEYAVRHAEYWAYSDMQITLIRSYGGTQQVSAAQILDTATDTGHVFFQLGIFLPIGTTIKVVYGGGYQTIPADLVRAGRHMAASIAAAELDPIQPGHDPDMLREKAVLILDAYARS